jgi:CheY-like chemotaxis protein
LTGEPAVRGSIVVAEDDPATRMMLGRVLARAGFVVHLCGDGECALEAVRRERPDMVLLDWMMPVMDGLRAAELLKTDVGTRSIPIVMITTHSQIEDRDFALMVGVQDFVTKPFNAPDLIACIDQQMRWRTIVVSARAVGPRGLLNETSARTPSLKPKVSNARLT